MCTMIAATLISTVVSAAGSMMQAQQQSAQMEMQAKMHERQRRLEREAGAHEAEGATRQGDRVLGSQRAGIAASGLDLNIGSSLDAQIDNSLEVQRDVDAIRWNSQIKQDNEKYKAQESRYNAKQTKKAGYLEAIVPFINGAAKLQGQFA